MGANGGLIFEMSIQTSELSARRLLIMRKEQCRVDRNTKVKSHVSAIRYTKDQVSFLKRMEPIGLVYRDEENKYHLTVAGRNVVWIYQRSVGSDLEILKSGGREF